MMPLCVMVVGGLASGSAIAQSTGSMTLVLIDDAKTRVAPVTALAGTLIVSRSNPMPSARSGEQLNKLDLVFDSTIWTNNDVLRWFATSGPRATAEFLVGGPDHTRITYTLSGITMRSMTATAQGGNAQASFILGADHVAVGNVALN